MLVILQQQPMAEVLSNNEHGFCQQFTCLNAIFLETDYNTLLFSVEYECTFTTKHNDAQHTHQERALDMLFFIQNSLNNKPAIVMTSTNVTVCYRIAMC